MPVIVRTTERLLRNVPLNWDKNRREVAGGAEGVLAASVCAIINASSFDKVPGGYKLKSTAPILEDDIRSRLEQGINQKKLELLHYYGDVPYSQKDVDDINGLPWPDPLTVDISAIQYRDQANAARGTGFSIGNNYVVTAGHVESSCSSQFQNPFTSSMWAVFGYTGSSIKSTVIPPERIFRLTRVILSVEPPNDMFTYQSPHDFVNNLQEMKAYSRGYDFAIFECAPLPGAPANARFPQALQLRNTPATTQIPISSIGCSHGLSFKYTDGSFGTNLKDNPDRQPGTIRAIWNTAPDNIPVPLDQQGTIYADIDVFKGNSGGPLFDLGSTRSNPPNPTVVGICKSGMLGAWLPDTDPSLATGVPSPATTLVTAVQRWMTSKPRATGQMVKREFLNFYLELAAQNDTYTAFSWIRFFPTSVPVTQVNAFTRTDPYAYFSSTLNTFPATAGYGITINVTVDIGQDTLALGAGLVGDLGLQIINSYDPPVVAEGDTMTNPLGAWAVHADTQAHWTLDCNNAAQQGRPATNAYPAKAAITGGFLNRDILIWNRGFCGWDNITVVRRLQPHQVAHVGNAGPTRATVEVVFTVPVPHSPVPSTFKFRLIVPFMQINPDTWTAKIGKRVGYPNAPHWQGPVA